MKLKHLNKHPHHTDLMTHHGYPLYDYQKELLDMIDSDYTLFLENGEEDTLRNTIEGPIIGNKKRMATLGTGDGKSFTTPYAIKKMAEQYFLRKNKYSISVVTSALSEVLVDHKKELLKFADSEQGKDFVILMGGHPPDPLIKIKTIDDYLDGKLNIEGKHIILIFTHKWLENNVNRLKKININFIIIDEAKAFNYGNNDEARREGDRIFGKDGTRKKKMTWWNNIESLNAYTIILNATPSIAHEENKFGHYGLFQVPESDKSWKQPWLEISNRDTSNYSKAQKIEKIVEDMKEYLVMQLQHNHLVDCIEKRYPIAKDKISRHIHAMIKCSSSKSKSSGLTVEDVNQLLIDLNKSLLGQKIKIWDYFEQKFFEVTYDNSLINPMIKDNKNKTSIDNINDPEYKDNVLLVCELGTYGINIGFLGLLIYIRDSKRNLGKEYTITQLLGRLARNGFVDNIFLCDLIVEINPNVEDNRNVKQAFMNLTRKKVSLFDSCVINDKALEKFKEKLPDEKDMSNTIDEILLEHFKWIPKDKKTMSSDGKGDERFYIDKRYKDCDICDNAIFDIHYNKLIEEGFNQIEAMYYTIKDIMDNGHTHTSDDGTQRSICKSCHAIETRKNKHYLPSDHPDRKKVEN